jgi:hypothetical protein
LHRKLSEAFLLCARLESRVTLSRVFVEALMEYIVGTILIYETLFILQSSRREWKQLQVVMAPKLYRFTGFRPDALYLGVSA